MDNEKLNRLKSPVLWTAICAEVVSILLLLGVIDVGQSEAINSIIASVLQIMVLLGICNNPTDKHNF